MTAYSTAAISRCGRYRYELIRRWGDDPMLEFVMLNPSTADANQDDPTIRRCIGYAKRWGYGALVVRNLFAYRATKPANLVNAVVGYPEGTSIDEAAFGPLNAAYLGNQIAECTIAAWGDHRRARNWFDTHRLNRPTLFCLGYTANGSPRHPLYLPKTTTPTPYPKG